MPRVTSTCYVVTGITRVHVRVYPRVPFHRPLPLTPTPPDPCLPRLPYSVAANLEDQDRELEDMRRELEEVREAIAAERVAQDHVIRSFRDKSTHLHRLRGGGDGGGGGGGGYASVASRGGVRGGTTGGGAVSAAMAMASMDDASDEPPTPPASRRVQGERYATRDSSDEHQRISGDMLRRGRGARGGGGAKGGGGVRGAWGHPGGGGGADHLGGVERAGNHGGGARHRFGNARRLGPM